jgi:hypothetical protein
MLNQCRIHIVAMYTLMLWLVQSVPRSSIYTASLEHSQQTRFYYLVGENRAGRVPDAKSLDDLYNGCTTVLSQSIKMSVGFARFFLFANCDIQRAAYLMKDVKNFLHLLRWAPASKLLDLEVFVTESTEWKRVDVRIIVAGSYLIAKASSSLDGPKLIDFVVNPTVKKVLMHFQELRDLMISSGETDGIKQVLRNVLLEMFCCKLGTTIQIDMSDQEIANLRLTSGIGDDLSLAAKSKAKKIIAAHCSKTGGMHAHSMIFHDRARCPRDRNLGLANTYITCS